MAEFRRCIYALALVALITGFAVSASAQGNTMQCSSSTANPPLVRAEGYTELLGDIVLDCTGGIPTNPNQSVPTVNLQVNLDVNSTAKTTAVLNNIEFLESLIIIDEPNSASNPTVPILNCGQTAAPDTSQAGPGVCSIIGGGSLGAATTYNGSSGHPNVFQGRSLRIALGQAVNNQIVFSGIPIDPPGTQCTNPVNGQCHRIIRITNMRGDATEKSVVVANVTQTITAQLIINPSTSLPLDNASFPIARVSLGLIPPTINVTNTAFVQCSSLESQSQGLAYTFKEGFNNAFKPMSLTQTLANGVAKPSYTYNGAGTPAALLTPNTGQVITNNQNVPGATYDSESGYVNALGTTAGDSPSNPLTGGTGAGVAFTNTGGAAALGTALAGTATQGTRLIMRFSQIPNGASISVPNIVNMTNVIGTNAITGVAVLITGTSASGFGGAPATGSVTPCQVTTPATSGCTAVTLTAGAGFAVYEVFFANPNALEQLVVPLLVKGTPNLPSNLPAPTGTTPAQIQGGFAPFYDTSDPIRRTAFAAGSENTAGTAPGGLGPATLPIPRFLQIAQPQTLFAIVRCSCNLLFPFVTNAPLGTGGNFDTGMAIANTSRDPGANFGFIANAAQSGPVQLWFYNRNNTTTAAEPNFLGQTNTQCTNATTAGSCSGTLTPVPAGGMLTYVLSSGGWIANDVATSGPPVLLGANGVTGGAFQGYIIAQASFQYCHGFAFISRQGGGFDNNNMAMGYQAIVLDTPGITRTASGKGENDGH